MEMEDNQKDHAEIKADIKEILRVLNGNGKTGLCAKVNFLWGSFVFMAGAVTIQAVILTRILLS
jgi:hypothetical protein